MVVKVRLVDHGYSSKTVLIYIFNLIWYENDLKKERDIGIT